MSFNRAEMSESESNPQSLLNLPDECAFGPIPQNSPTRKSVNGITPLGPVEKLIKSS